MTGARGLPAYAVLTLNHRLLHGRQLQPKAKLVSNAPQLFAWFGYVRLPIAVPHQTSLGIHARNTGSGSIQPFLTIKPLPGDIAQRDVCHPQVVHKPGVAAGVARNPLPEERELKAEPVTVHCLQIPGVVPPLGLIVLMIEVVSGKRERVTRLCDVIIRRGRAGHGEKQQCKPLIPQAPPPWDPTGPRAAPETAPPAPWQHTPRSTSPAAPQPANGIESSTRMTAC